MGAPTNEAGLVNAIRRAVAAEHPTSWQFKVVGSPMQVAGVPDLLAVVEGRLFGFEVKFQRPGESEAHARGRVTAQQQYVMDQIERAGGVARCVLSAREALDVIAAHVGPGSVSEDMPEQGHAEVLPDAAGAVVQ